MYNVIFDVIGNRSLSDILARLSPKGRYVSAVPRMPQALGWKWTARFHGKRVIEQIQCRFVMAHPLVYFCQTCNALECFMVFFAA